MDKQKLYQTVEEKSDLLKSVSDKIWEYAEISMKEFKSTETYLEVLEAEGFRVEKNLCNIPTAFSGTFGSGSPRIGILGEYDALSGLSQEACITEKKPLVEGACGQGCGHNLLGAASLGAAIAVKKAIEVGELKGTVIFYGCPGEEGCAGKTFMARDGMFRDLDAALCWHPGDTNEVTIGSNHACLQLVYTFRGISAHAAGDPFNGRSALDAAELMNVGVQFLREHMEPKCAIHYSFADAGGLSPNVVQPYARMIYMVRAENVRKAKALLKRVDNIAKGAALMTDTTVSSYQLDGTSNVLSNTVLEKVLYENLKEAPMPEYTAEELEFAAKLRATYPHGELPGIEVERDPALLKAVRELSDWGKKDINDFVVPYMPAKPFVTGSTDVGDVSWLTPTAQITTATWTSNVPGHSWQVVSTGKTGIGYKGMLLAAKVLAGAAADMMEKPEILQEAREEFNITAAEGYDCPIGPELIPQAQ